MRNFLKLQIDQPIGLLTERIKLVENNYKNLIEAYKSIKDEMKK